MDSWFVQCLLLLSEECQDLVKNLSLLILNPWPFLLPILSAEVYRPFRMGTAPFCSLAVG